jgi:hypothetical protein
MNATLTARGVLDTLVLLHIKQPLLFESSFVDPSNALSFIECLAPGLAPTSEVPSATTAPAPTARALGEGKDSFRPGRPSDVHASSVDLSKDEDGEGRHSDGTSLADDDDLGARDRGSSGAIGLDLRAAGLEDPDLLDSMAASRKRDVDGPPGRLAVKATPGVATETITVGVALGAGGDSRTEGQEGEDDEIVVPSPLPAGSSPLKIRLAGDAPGVDRADARPPQAVTVSAPVPPAGDAAAGALGGEQEGGQGPAATEAAAPAPLAPPPLSLPLGPLPALDTTASPLPSLSPEVEGESGLGLRSVSSLSGVSGAGAAPGWVAHLWLRQPGWRSEVPACVRAVSCAQEASLNAYFSRRSEAEGSIGADDILAKRVEGLDPDAAGRWLCVEVGALSALRSVVAVVFVCLRVARIVCVALSLSLRPACACVVLTLSPLRPAPLPLCRPPCAWSGALWGLVGQGRHGLTVCGQQP